MKSSKCYTVCFTQLSHHRTGTRCCLLLGSIVSLRALPPPIPLSVSALRAAEPPCAWSAAVASSWRKKNASVQESLLTLTTLHSEAQKWKRSLEIYNAERGCDRFNQPLIWDQDTNEEDIRGQFGRLIPLLLCSRGIDFFTAKFSSFLATDVSSSAAQLHPIYLCPSRHEPQWTTTSPVTFQFSPFALLIKTDWWSCFEVSN